MIALTFRFILSLNPHVRSVSSPQNASDSRKVQRPKETHAWLVKNSIFSTWTKLPSLLTRGKLYCTSGYREIIPPCDLLSHANVLASRRFWFDYQNYVINRPSLRATWKTGCTRRWKTVVDKDAAIKNAHRHVDRTLFGVGYNKNR